MRWKTNLLLKDFQRKQYSSMWIVLITVCIILVTRAFSLTYHMAYHPDERCFFSSTNSLMRSIFDANEVFTEFKEYPEGAYLFQLPFHLIGEVFGRLKGLNTISACGDASAPCSILRWRP